MNNCKCAVDDLMFSDVVNEVNGYTDPNPGINTKKHVIETPTLDSERYMHKDALSFDYYENF